MPNRFTRVPARPVPSLPALVGRLVLPVADAFMVAMVSRPASGSLRTTWVTPATLALGVLTALAGLLVAVLGISGVVAWGGAARAVAALLGIGFVVGGGAVVTIGSLQRR
jgi:hypothetical protein